MKPNRSALYLPASNPRAIAKAQTLAADIVILDLEDAVSPDAKVIARTQALDAVGGKGFGKSTLVVRCNGLDTPWGREDCLALAQSGVEAVLAPKISTSADVALYREALGTEPALWAMIETCEAIFNLKDIALGASTQGLAAFVFGSNDLAKEMRCRPGPDRTALLPALALTVTAARLAGIIVLDGVCNAIEDLEVLEQQCRQAVDLGFDGKTLIHPAQIDTANRLFAPDAEEVRHAQAIVAAFARSENAALGAIRVDGKMVERLHLAQARHLLDLTAAIEAMA